MRFQKDQPVKGGPITADNYKDLAMAHARFRGAGYVIRGLEGTDGALASCKPPTEAQWVAWMAYFETKGIPHGFALARGMTTVPCEWPEDFDVDWPKSDRHAMIHRRPIALHTQARVAAMMRELADKLTEGFAAPSPRFKPRAPEDAAADYVNRPATLSSELRRQLALEPNATSLHDLDDDLDF